LEFDIIKLSEGVEVFKVLPYRSVVEYTFELLGGYRRLSKDYKGLPELALHIYDLMIIINPIDHPKSICPLTK
jgi:hypothetical protein